MFYRNIVSDAGITYVSEEGIFGSLLAPVSSKPISVFAEPFCNTIGCYENLIFFASLKIMIVENAMLLQLHSSKESVICGYYSSLSVPDRYYDGYIISKDLSECFISSFVVLCNNHKEASNDLAIILISNQIMISYFGLDIASQSSILLYGTLSANGNVYYTVLPSADQGLKKISLKSYLLLSMSQPVIKVLPFRLFTGDTEVGANSLFFIGKEGKICILFSSGRSKDHKNFFLNVPVYSACFLQQYLLISSYKEIIVINLECKDDNIKETLCISALLVKAFCNPHILKINSVMKMFVDTKRYIVLLVKRNGYIYALNEVDLASRLLSPFWCNLKEIVTRFREVSDEVDLFKDDLSTTETHLKQIKNSINLFLNVDLNKEDSSLITCSLLPVTYVRNKGDLSVKLDFKYEFEISGNVYVSIMASSKCTYSFSFYSQARLAQDENFPQNLMLSIKDLPFQVTWSVYYDFNTKELFNIKEIVRISSVLKQENFNVLDLLKEFNSNVVVQQDQLCNTQGFLTLSKQSWQMLKNISWAKLSLDKLFCIASETASLQCALFASYKENIMHIGHLGKNCNEDNVIARLFTNSAPFACELRAGVIEKLKVNVFLCFIAANIYIYALIALTRCFIVATWYILLFHGT